MNKRKNSIIELGLILVTDGGSWNLISEGFEFSIQKTLKGGKYYVEENESTERFYID